MAQCYLVNKKDNCYVAGDSREGAGRTERSVAAFSPNDYGGKIYCDEDVGEDGEITEEPYRRFRNVNEAIVQHQKILRDDAVPAGECENESDHFFHGVDGVL